jgi:phage replication-related protein YjqB (UPF0714/DUF867 family)
MSAPGDGDTYSCFAELVAAEAPSAFTVQYHVQEDGPADLPRILCIAPHGGRIEPHTDAIAKSCALALRCSFYAFVGHRPSNNRRLHITSTRFDEPHLLALLAAHDIAIAMHGTKDEPLRAVAFVGGRQRSAAEALVTHLLPASGFTAVLCEPGARFGGAQGDNVTNRGRSGAGLQLEMSLRLRDELVSSPDRMAAFAGCLRVALEHAAAATTTTVSSSSRPLGGTLTDASC